MFRKYLIIVVIIIGNKLFISEDYFRGVFKICRGVVSSHPFKKLQQRPGDLLQAHTL